MSFEIALFLNNVCGLQSIPSELLSSIFGNTSAIYFPATESVNVFCVLRRLLNDLVSPGTLRSPQDICAVGAADLEARCSTSSFSKSMRGAVSPLTSPSGCTFSFASPHIRKQSFQCSRPLSTVCKCGSCPLNVPSHRRGSASPKQFSNSTRTLRDTRRLVQHMARTTSPVSVATKCLSDDEVLPSRVPAAISEYLAAEWQHFTCVRLPSEFLVRLSQKKKTDMTPAAFSGPPYRRGRKRPEMSLFC